MFLKNAYFILDLAKKQRLDKTGSFERNVAQKFEAFLLTRMEQEIYSEYKIPDDSLLAFYKMSMSGSGFRN